MNADNTKDISIIHDFSSTRVPETSGVKALLQQYSNHKELAKLARLLPQRLPKQQPEPVLPQVRTLQCRRCRYVSTGTSDMKQCPNCHASLQVNRDRFNIYKELTQEYGRLNLYRQAPPGNYPT